MKKDEPPEISNLSFGDVETNKLDKSSSGGNYIIRVPGEHYGKAFHKSFEDFKSKTGRSEIKIYSWNVNGFSAVSKKAEFKEFMNECEPDILCLNETKIDKDKLIKT